MRPDELSIIYEARHGSRAYGLDTPESDEDFKGLDVGSMHLITSAEASDELIYELTRAIYENRDQVTAKHAAGKAINPANRSSTPATTPKMIGIHSRGRTVPLRL